MKVLEEEIVAKSNYATTIGIRVGESSGAKASFWPEVLENTEKTDSNEIRSTAEGIGGFDSILCSATTELSMYAQRQNKNKEETQDINVENPLW